MEEATVILTLIPVPPPTQQQEQTTTPNTPNTISADSYTPYPFTQEQLIYLAQTAVPRASFDVSLLSDDEEEATAAATASYYSQSVYTAADTGIVEGVTEDENLTDAQKSSRAKKIVNAFWRNAVKLAVFPDSIDVPYKDGRTVKLSQITTSHPGIGKNAVQNRYVYVFTNGRVTKPTLETFPYTQINGGCQHEIMGTDCVGFVYHAMYAATKDYNVRCPDQGNKIVVTKGTRARLGPERNRIANPDNWKIMWLFPNAKLVTVTGDPKPGDILVWSGHVGVAVRINYETIGVAHSYGMGPYTCDQYYNNASQDIEWVGYPSEYKTVDGFIVHTYEHIKNGQGLGTETYRLRLEETTPYGEYDDDELVVKLSGKWKPVIASMRDDYYSAYGSLEDSIMYKLAKYNPYNEDSSSSSLVINVSASKQIPDNGYQTLAPEYLISNDGLIALASTPLGHGTMSPGQFLTYVYNISTNSGGAFHRSNDILVRQQSSPSDYYGAFTEDTKIIFPSDSSMVISSLNRLYEGGRVYESTDLTVQLERVLGRVVPESDDWIEKLSGDWEPVDFSALHIGDDYQYQFSFIPYDANDPDNSSAPKITLIPERWALYYYVECYGQLCAGFESGDTTVKRYNSDFGADLTGLMLFEVSGDMLVRNDPISGSGIENDKRIIAFPTKDTITIDVEYDDSDTRHVEEHIELKRIK